MNPYEVLGVKRTADLKQIKAVYRLLAAVHHPDKSGGNQEKFNEVKLAFDILSNPEQRKRYDVTGRVDESPVTEKRLQIFMDQTIRTVVEAVRADGTSDDPVWENIRDKLIMNCMGSRIPLRNDRFKLERQLERATRMLERFKPTAEFDPIGESLKRERERLQSELRINQDAMELSVAAENVFKSYEYAVGPELEGQSSPGPTIRPLLGGLRRR